MRCCLVPACFLLEDCLSSYRSSSDISQFGRRPREAVALSAFVFFGVPDFEIDIVWIL